MTQENYVHKFIQQVHDEVLMDAKHKIGVSLSNEIRALARATGKVLWAQAEENERLLKRIRKLEGSEPV